MRELRIGDLTATDLTPVGGGDICRAFRGRTIGGSDVFVKTLADAPPGFFVAEARGLDTLRCADGPPVPEVLAVDEHGIALEWIAPGPTPDGESVAAFGRALARLHAGGCDGFGAPVDGFIGALPLDNRPADDWPEFYVRRRVEPYLSALDAADRAVVEDLCERIADIAGPAEPPALLHGDLWSGNVHWDAHGRGWLVDAASVHGGHRETDLAMLALFGGPRLDVLLSAYDDEFALAGGWEQRRPLHQLHPLLVHAQLFGGSYGPRAAALAAELLRH